VKRATERALRPAAGFTLLEVIIAVTLVALMSVVIWSAFRISIASWSRGTADIDVNQRRRTILDLVKKQMASIYGVIAPVNIESGGTVYPIFWGERDSVQFVSLVSLRFQDNPGLTLVSYDLVADNGAAGSYALVEREQPYLGMDPTRESLFDRSDENSVAIFENLTSFSFEYLDPGGQDRPPQWIQAWNPRDMGRLPTAIRVNMIAHDAGRMVTRQIVAPIPATPYDPRLTFVNPLQNPLQGRPTRPREDDPRAR
jgi:general secretion pathway protein J